MGRIEIVRVYDAEKTTGRRFLVDRLWPRGVKKEELHLDGWFKDAGPSDELRRWFGHDPQRWAEFRRRYTAELDAHPEGWQPLLEAARDGDITLLYGAKDTERNQAVVLRDHLLRAMEKA
jgi:uncharacterized protein YeaO (DUF488 family)